MPFLLLILLTVLSTLAWAGDVAATTSGRLPELRIPDVCGMQLKAEYTTAKDLDQMQAIGVTFVRRGFHWKGIEAVKGTYDFSAHDPVMADLRARGIRVMGVLVFGNDYYSSVVTDEGRAAYARYAAALAEHYKADKVMWEIWNEPNTKTFWGKQGGGTKGNTEQYAEQYVALVRAVDPDATILGGSVSNLWEKSYEWCDYAFARGVLKTGIDAWSVHPYSPKLPEDYAAAYDTVRDLMAKHGGPRDFPMLNSERGFPTSDEKAEGYAGGKTTRMQEYQAWLLVRQQLVDLSYGMHGTLYYEWKNAKEGFGIYNDDKPSQASTALATLIAQLKGHHFTTRLTTPLPHDWVLSFTGPGDSLKLVAWTAAKEGAKLDSTEPHTIELPIEATGQVAVVSMAGATSTLPVVNGKIAVNLDGGPQFITIRAGK
jgi:polysaccharide biosynthesis protein PslG